MENLSHTVIGLAVGEALHRLLPSEENGAENRVRRRLFLSVSAIAGNFPDLDLVLTPLLPEPLGYLLHHRGHTHTFLFALPQALLAGAILPLFWKNARRLLQSSKRSLAGYFILLFGGFVLFGVYIAAVFWGSSQAKEILRRHYRPVALVDAAISAYPANPFCWMYSVITLPPTGNDALANEYSVEKGALSLFPVFVEASACPRAFVAAKAVSSSPFVEVYSSKAYSLRHARNLYQSNCFFRAFARFARIPAIEENRSWDARFQRGKIENNFSYIDLSAFGGAQCPGPIPQWGVPRKDILGPAGNML